MSKKKIIDVCVFGTGNQGKAHAAAVQAHPRARVAYVVGELSFKDQVEEFTATYGDENTKIFYDVEQALKNKIDLVIIASPDPTHFPIVMSSLKAGVKDIFCEKPLGVGYEEISKIDAEIKKLSESDPQHPPRVVCGFQRRYDNDFLEVKKAIDTGVIGNVEVIRLIARDPCGPGDTYKPPPSAQTVVYNSMSHDIDMARFLAGENPTDIYAVRQLSIDGGNPKDMIVAVLKFPSGKLCTLEWIKGITYGYVQSAEVQGDKGMVRNNDFPCSNVVTYVDQSVGSYTPPTLPFFPQRYKYTYADEIKEVVDIVVDRIDGLNKRKYRVTIEDCIQVAKIADRIVADIAKNSENNLLSNSNYANEKVATFPALHPDPWKPTRSPKLRIALVGAGRMGGIRAAVINRHPRTEVLYVVDVFTEAAQKCAQKYGGKAVASVDEALKDPNVDAVWIAVGTTLHYEIIQKAAQAKKPIFCEKPISLSQKEIYDSFKVINDHKVPLMCGWNRRFDPNFGSIYKTISQKSNNNNSFGNTKMITAVCGDHPLPPTNILIALGSIYHDLMVHDIDVVLWFTGELPKTIYATGNCFIKDLQSSGVIDTAVLVMTFPSKGIIAYLTARRKSVHGYDQRLEIVGSGGTALFADNPVKTTVVHKQPKGDFRDKMSYTFEDRYDESYYAEVDNFANLVLGREDGGDTKPSTFEESFYVSILTDAALKSFTEKKVVVIDYQPQK